jgi:hypothetical protein
VSIANLEPAVYQQVDGNESADLLFSCFAYFFARARATAGTHSHHTGAPAQ